MPYENKESGKREQIPEDEVTCRRGINKRRGASEWSQGGAEWARVIETETKQQQSRDR